VEQQEPKRKKTPENRSQEEQRDEKNPKVDFKKVKRAKPFKAATTERKRKRKSMGGRELARQKKGT